MAKKKTTRPRRSLTKTEKLCPQCHDGPARLLSRNEYVAPKRLVFRMQCKHVTCSRVFVRILPQ